MVIKSIRKLTRIRNNGAIQPQFFYWFIVGATGSKFLNGLPCFSRITFRLTKSITIIRCFRSLDVIVHCISQLVFRPVAWSFDSIASLLAASRWCLPFFNSEFIQGAFFYSSAFSSEWSMKVNNIQKFRFPVIPQNIWIITAVKIPVLPSDIGTKTLSIKIFKISVRNG